MSIHFTEKERTILEDVATEVDEFLVDTRKGIGQSKYVFEVKADATWYDWDVIVKDPERKVPGNLVGFWMMDDSDDLEEYNMRDCLKRASWVKCRQQPVTTVEWVEL